MGWLAVGILCTVLYFAAGQVLAGQGPLFLTFRLAVLLLPPLTGVVVIIRHRHRWAGCQWLFWATISLGLLTTAIGHVGWMIDDLLLQRESSWLGWHAVFIMFGTAAPLLALLAQPHRGAREKAAATTAVDIASVAVIAGFLYSYLVTTEDLAAGQAASHLPVLLVLAEVQPLIVLIGMSVAALVGRRLAWADTYRRLALGLALNFVTLTLTNLAIWQGLYRPGFVYDFMWILPFMFYPWAAAKAPSSEESAPHAHLESPATTSRPWLVFSILVLIPALDFAFRRLGANGVPDASRDLTTAVTVVSVLPLLLARLVVERSEARHSDDQVRLLAGAIEQADELIAIRTADRRFVYANDAFCRALGYARGELIFIEARELFDAEWAERSEAIAAGCREGKPWRGAFTRRRRDGTTFPAAGAVVPLADAVGRITHILSVERNITDEMTLREQLIHTERLSAVGQLVAGVAHELNNPLQSVVGYTELLLDQEVRDSARGDLQQIKTQAMRAAAIVRNLLSFVRRAPTARTVEDLNGVVQATVALRRYDLTTSNIAVNEDYGADLPPVHINREEIQQVVLNLVLNAEHAMQRWGRPGVLRVTTRRVDGHACVEVRDSGPGVPAALAGQIFEPFFTTKEPGEGTGLGLSIALGIATAHGGALDLCPGGEGACFRLTLPAADVQKTGQPRAGARELVS